MSPPIDRVTWKLYSPFAGAQVSAEFAFAGKSGGRRWDGIRYTAFQSARYAEPETVGGLDVETSDFLVLAHVRRGQRASRTARVSATYPHLPRLTDGAAAALDLFRDGCFERVDATGYAVTDKGLKTAHLVEDLCSGGSLAFAPIVWGTADDPDVGGAGVRMYLNDWEHFGDATLEGFGAWVQFMDRFDLFQVSLAAAQLAAAGRQKVPPKSLSSQPVRRTAKT